MIYKYIQRNRQKMPNQRVNGTARVSFFLKIEKLLDDVLPINFIENPCCPLPKR